LRADISVLVQICGVGWALLLAGWFFLRDYTEVERGKGKDAAKLLAAEDRRRFLGRLDHELKNPLTAIQVSLVNIKEKPDPQILESIQAQTQRLNQLVVDLRKLSDLETRPIECAPVNLTDILKTVAGITNESCSAKQIKLILNLPQAPWPLPPISGDSDLLLLAFHNLLDNSCKFSEPGDMIEVRAFEDGAMVVVEVADTGPGIPEDEVDHIWEELYRGQGARGIPGSGLGLSLVRVIIGRHNGQINLRSRTGEGTVATIRLPTVSQ
jgi:two-component system OmpR family sensor kinase